LHVHIENFLTNQLVKNFENWSTFAKVIIKYPVASFLGGDTMYNALSKDKHTHGQTHSVQRDTMQNSTCSPVPAAGNNDNICY